MIDTNIIFLPLFGFLIGLLVSTLGGGGGGLFVPILTLVFGIPTQVAIATSLASVLPTTLMGAFSHYRQGNVEIRTGLILGIGGIIGTLLGAYFANMIPSILLRKILGIFTLIMLIPMLLSVRKRRKDTDEIIEGNEDNNKDENKINSNRLTGTKRIIASFFGVASGIMAGVFGISGTPPVIAGLYSLGLPAMLVVGTSVFVLIFNSVAGIGGYYLLGRLDMTLIILLGGGSAIGAFLGPVLLKKIDSATIEKIYAPLLVGMMLILGLAMIFA
ncbi:sulfite exporter TauE/SafE family protein [Methanobacterium spitsbergense]|uniref:Probable membrane transporter protein n=1 Tax=Methanobacterium spitsbergense TaxID=2874285 RepID=A0A8T5UW40_9EURY|nr:sulfite exporter TauE/SafE family protein [Methanobacterium spitsbergense]MBZ2166477.1 sulfite exporter TauE/SafE family protein [Methanobacterium spitsbergense]